VYSEERGPQHSGRAGFGPAAHVTDSQSSGVDLNGLDIDADRRQRANALATEQLMEECRLTGVCQAHHQHALLRRRDRRRCRPNQFRQRREQTAHQPAANCTDGGGESRSTVSRWSKRKEEEGKARRLLPRPLPNPTAHIVREAGRGRAVRIDKQPINNSRGERLAHKRNARHAIVYRRIPRPS
jgi:hypothetical protein